MKRAALLLIGFATALCATAYAQAPAAGGTAPAASAPMPAVCGVPPATPAAATPPPARAGQAPATPARGSGGQSVGSQGDPDPGVHFIVICDNPSVRVLQVTLQPGAMRRQHVHNDVTFHMLVPVTGTLEVTEGSLTDPTGKEVISALPGQAYYMVKGQPHGFANKTAAPVQVIEVFVKGETPAPWPVPFTPPPAPAPAAR